LIAVVVFPTPPFWLAIAITFPKFLPLSARNLTQIVSWKQIVSRGT
jgi:hypothetical protein